MFNYKSFNNNKIVYSISYIYINIDRNKFKTQDLQNKGYNFNLLNKYRFYYNSVNINLAGNKT